MTTTAKGDSRFSPSVLNVPGPSVLSHSDWLKDPDFLAELCASWHQQYAEYIGQDAAKELIQYLRSSGEIFAHEPEGTLTATMDDQYVGVAAVRALQGVSMISLLEVRDKYRCCGIGQQLINALTTVGEPLFAHVSIHRPHVKAFYSNRGFLHLDRNPVDHYGHALIFDIMARPFVLA